MNTPETKPNAPEEGKMERLMRKVRADSKWNGLSTEQCETVERWLFDENVSYTETAERVKREFGMETSPWSVGRFYRQRARVRQAMELLESQVASDQLGAIPAKTQDLRATMIKLIAKSAVRMAIEKPGEVERLMPLAKMLLDSEENEIRLRRVKLEERYYDFQANGACAKELEKVRSYLRAVGDNEHLNETDKQNRVIGLLFGRDTVDVQEAGEAESVEERAKLLEHAEDGHVETAKETPGAGILEQGGDGA